MKFSLIVCTYRRSGPLCNLLESVAKQSLYPNEIIIVDGSTDDTTERAINQKEFPYLHYYRIKEKDRGLTRQRNFGISKVAEEMEVVCFLDDDIVLTSSYFENLLNTYRKIPDAIGVGGYILNEGNWHRKTREASFEEFEFDGWVRNLGSRNALRKQLGLLSNRPPGYMPEFSHGLSTGFLPPSREIYPVEFFMGGVSSYRRTIFEKVEFSTYFEGYGLYEDMDFCLRASRYGQLYVNTGAQLYHYHEEGGRPNHFKYGKMVIRNGWYVWRVKYPSPGLKAQLKWYGTAFLLTLIRTGNVINTEKKKEAFTESLGRLTGWASLILSKPK